MTCNFYGFPCEKDFLTNLQIPPESLATRWDFLTYFTLQGALIMINTLFRVEDHENHVDLSHNCYQHGGKSQVCEIYSVLEPS